MSILDIEHTPPAVGPTVPRVVGVGRRGEVGSPKDSAVVSDTARVLRQQLVDRSLDHIRARVRDGFYLQAGVVEEILAKVWAEAVPGLHDSTCRDLL